MSFPLALETGTVFFNTKDNSIDIKVEKEELRKYGISPQFGSIELPAKIGNTAAGVRIYQSPTMKKTWNRITINISFIQDFIQRVQNRPLIYSATTKIQQQIGDLNWEDFDLLFEMLSTEEFSKEALSLKDISKNWVVFDEAPDSGKSDDNYFLKPPFMDDLKSTALIFLSQDYQQASGPSLTLMMIQLGDRFQRIGAADMSGALGELSKKIESELKNLDKKESFVSMQITGNGIISNEMDEVTMEANMIIMPSIFVVISLILLIMFKRLSYLLLPLASLGISIVWLFGTLVLLGMNFNMMMVAIVPLLMGLGVDYSVHLFHEYQSELKKGKKPGPAIISSIQGVGMAMFLATLTTVIAFSSFLTASVPPLRDFGILCAIGIIYTLLTALTFQTATRYLLDRKKTTSLAPRNHNKISLELYMKKFSDVVLKQRKIILVFTMIVTLILALGAVQVETTFDLNDFLPEGNESIELMMDISDFFPSSSENQEFILIEGDIATVETLQGIAKTYENLKDDNYITKTPNGDPKQFSILSVIQDAIRDNLSVASEFNIDTKGIPQTNQDVVGIYNYLYDRDEYLLDVRSVLHRSGTEYDATVIRIYTTIDYSEDNTIDTNKQMGIVYHDIQNDVETYGDADVIVTGMSSSMYTIMDSMTSSQLLSTLISILLAALVLIIVFKNPLLGIITVIPVGICIVWIVGTIYYLGYAFNIMTIMVTSLTIGIGIDYAIHATQRFRLTADQTGDITQAVSKTIGHTGGALFIAALTTAAGFSMLILAPMPPEQQFGIITSMTIIYSYIASIFVLPPILMKWGEWRKKKKGFIITPNKTHNDEYL
jgi:hydrophobe/amphiphile efflux-3 (HAE3) family protein